MRHTLLAGMLTLVGCSGYTGIDFHSPTPADAPFAEAVVELRNHQYLTLYAARVIPDSIVGYIDRGRTTRTALASANVVALHETHFSAARTTVLGAFLLFVGFHVLGAMFPYT